MKFYTLFRIESIFPVVAIAAQKRAMITAKIAKHWSNDDLPNLQSLSKSLESDVDIEDDDNRDALNLLHKND